MSSGSWGPSHQRPPKRFFNGPGPAWFQAWMTVVILAWLIESQTLLGFVAIVGGGFVVAVIFQIGIQVRDQQRNPPTGGLVESGDPLVDVLARARAAGGGIYLGLSEKGHWRAARPEQAVLVLGPPRSGKSSGVIVPAILSHQGAVVSTSTKPDVLAGTAGARSRVGKVWEFDPTGTAWAGVGERLRWSPVFASREWDQALLMARAMVSATRVGAGTTDQSHWSRRAQALLAPLLHAAAVSGREIDAVLAWVLQHETDEPGVLLERHQGSPLAAGMLTGLQNTEQRERSSIFSAAADALDAYTGQQALAVARDQNLHADRLVHSQDTIYIHAPAEHQAAAAPLVCGLLADIRRATYQALREGTLTNRALFALDEVANVAPLDELPQIASEGGSQGLSLLAALQDLSQARGRWREAADGFLTLFGSKLILPGIADQKTLEGISVALGEYDRQAIATTRGRTAGQGASRSTTTSTQRQRVLSPGEIAGIPAGHALHLDGVRWELLTLTPAHRDQPWKTLSELPIGAQR